MAARHPCLLFNRIKQNICNLPGRTLKTLMVHKRHVTTGCNLLQGHISEEKLPSLFILSSINIIKEVNDPIVNQPLVYDKRRLPLIDIPRIPLQSDLGLPAVQYSNKDEVVGDLVSTEGLLTSSLIKKRKKKMNKHKYKKRIDRDIAKIRKIRVFRMRKKRGRQAHKKALLAKKLDRVLKRNPKSDLPHRPYVIYRLKNW